MKKKTLTLFALVLALVLSFSLAIMAGCKKGNSVSGDGTAVSLVTDESLQGKLLAMYTFEDSDSTLKATDPYTGEALEANNGTYGENARRVAIPAEHGSSTAIFDTSTYFSVGGFDATQIDDEFEDYTVVDGNEYDGLSFSFWAYNYETLVGELESLGESADWSNVMTNGYESITWGNLSHMQAGTADGSYRAFYPSNGTEVGRGAYTEEGYNALRNIQATKTRLSTYSGTNERYSVWNAISGNTQGEGSTDNDYIPVVAAAYLNTWRYVTINIDLEEGLSFYANGRLAYRYDPDTFNTPGGWDQIYADFVMSIMAEYQESDDYYLNMFGSESGIYVDDLIVGKALTADDACNLYENVSGTTWTDADLTITSLLDEEQAQEQEEKEAAIREYLEKTADSLLVEGDVWGSDADPEKQAGVSGSDTNDDGVITDVVGTARNEFEYVAGDYIETVGDVSLNNSVVLAGSNSYAPKVNEDGTFEMTVSGIQLSKGEGNYQGTYVSIYDGDAFVGALRIDWAASNNITGSTWDTDKVIMPTDTNGQITGNMTWVNTTDNGVYLNVVQRFCKLDITFKYDGTKLTVTYDIYYHYAGETVELTTASGTKFSYDVPKDDTTLFNTVTYEILPAAGLTLDTALDLENMSIRFGAENSAFLITDANGALTTKAAAYTYAGAWQPDDTYAKVLLPSTAADFDVTYTADVYTAVASGWQSPAFYLIDSNDTSLTAATLNGVQLLGVRGDNWAGVCMNLNEANAGTAQGAIANCTFPKTINYITQSTSDDFRYQLGDVLYTNGVTDLCDVTPVKMFVNIVYDAGTDTYTVTYYRDEATEANIFYQFSVVFQTGENVVLCIGGEATYMENIEIKNNTPDGEALTIAGGKTTSGTKTQVSTDGYTPVSQD